MACWPGFATEPNPSHDLPGWQATPIDDGASGYFAYWDAGPSGHHGAQDYGSSHITPDWANSTVNSTRTEVVFHFRPQRQR